MSSVNRVLLPLMILAFLINASVYAADLKIGDKAPIWTGIPGVDDKPHSLFDYNNAKLLVMVFTCNHCPVAQAYQDRLIELQKEYQSKDVQIIAVNVNNIPADRLDAMKKRAADKGFNFPYLYDETQKIGRDYGAKVTPHVFVLDKDRNVVYMGAVDDNMKVADVKKHYLRDAIDALLVNAKPPEDVTKQFGCSIKYD